MKRQKIVLHLLLVAMVIALVSLVVAPVPVYAAVSLSDVIDSVRNWVAGLLAGLATLFLMVGGIRYLTAAGNRRDMERGKEAMRSAVVGYVLAALSPLLMQILRQIVGL